MGLVNRSRNTPWQRSAMTSIGHSAMGFSLNFGRTSCQQGKLEFTFKQGTDVEIANTN